jgi:2-dehydro-3-deoxygluconokinase
VDGSPTDRTDGFDVVTLGETMVAFVSRDDPRHYLAVMAGAESNVAVGMARLGCRAQWVSRLGDDPLGRFVEESVTAGGVEVAVVRDASRPTGVMTKHVSDSGTRSQYYRSESVARELIADDLLRAGSARWMHVTGITAALSPSAAGLVEAVLDRRAGHTGGVSLDVNYRPPLWPDAATAAEVLLPLARRADVVFVGNDEAEALFGTFDDGALADLILERDDQELVLKQGALGASVATRDGTTFQPALAVDVVDETGAGDACAAGYLAGRLFGWPVEARIRLGHLMGSRVVGVLEDVPPPFEAVELEGLSPGRLATRWE